MKYKIQENCYQIQIKDTKYKTAPAPWSHKLKLNTIAEYEIWNIKALQSQLKNTEYEMQKTKTLSVQNITAWDCKFIFTHLLLQSMQQRRDRLNKQKNKQMGRWIFACFTQTSTEQIAKTNLLQQSNLNSDMNQSFPSSKYAFLQATWAHNIT